MQINRVLFTIQLLVISFKGVYSQSSAYNTLRSSFSITYQKEPFNAGQYYYKNVPLEFKRAYDWNLIKSGPLSVNSTEIDQVARELTALGVGNELIAHWWCRQPDGSFRADTVLKRGLGTVTDEQVKIVRDQWKGNGALQDMGLHLINRSFVLYIVPKNLKTMRQVYDEQDRQVRTSGNGKLAERTRRGYQGEATAYLLKLNYDDAAKADFYDKMWIYEDDTPEVRQEKIKAFEKYRFSLVPIKEISVRALIGGGDISATVPTDGSPFSSKSDAALLEDWSETVIKKAMEKAVESDIAPIAQINKVYEKRPIKCKITTREGAHVEKKYIVYEIRESRSGRTKLKRRAVVRAKRVPRFSGESDGVTEMSTFYRVGGLGFVQPGMAIKEKRELGIGMHTLATIPLEGTSPIRDYGVGLEGNLSLYLGKTGWQKVPTGLKLGVNYTSQRDELPLYSGAAQKVSVSRLSAYLRKDIYFLSIFHLGFWGGYGSDTVSERDVKENEEGDQVSSAIVPVGAEFGMNFLRLGHFFCQSEYVFPVGDVKVNDSTNASLDWFDLYPDRKGGVVRAGFRVQF